MARKLTAQQEDFASYYAECLNAGKAAILAGYSERGAFVQGHKLLRNPNVSKRIKELRADIQESLEITPQMIVSKLWEIANFDPEDMYDDEGEILPIDKMPRAVRQVISQIDVKEIYAQGVDIGESKKYKTYDKLKALDLLGRYLGMWKDTVLQQNNTQINVQMDKNDPLIKEIEQKLTGEVPMIDVTPIKVKAGETTD